jgi:hypothetical protein
VFSAVAKQWYAQTTNTTDPTPAFQGNDVEGTGPDENAQALLTIYEACWISDYNVSFASDTALVQESVTINVSDILAGTDISYTGAEPYSTLDTEGKGRSVRLTM